MALSNIFREPQREITESVVGVTVSLAIVALLAWPDYLFAQWFEEVTGGPGHGCPIPIGLIFFGPLVGLGLVMAAMATHAIGDAICDAFQRRGIHLRPRERR